MILKISSQRQIQLLSLANKLIVLCLCFLLANCKPTEKGDLVFLNVNVIDVVNGEVLEGQDVIVQGSKISNILDHGSAKLESDSLIDGTDQYIIPGLWDMHVHIHEHAELFLPMFLAHGITGIRDLGNITLSNMKRWKTKAAAHPFAPRVGAVAGSILDGTDSRYNPKVVKSPEEVPATIDTMLSQGSDFIKIYAHIPKETLKRIVRESQERDVPYAGHYVWGMDLAELSDMGFSSIEHLEISLSYAKNSEELLDKYRNMVANGNTKGKANEYHNDLNIAHQNRDSLKMASLFSRLKENETWQCTAVLALVWALSQQYNTENIKEIGLDKFPDSLRTKFIMQNHDIPDKVRLQEKTSLEVNMDIVKKLYDFDVPLLAGSHASPTFGLLPGVSLYKEMELMQDAGIPAPDVLKTATINPIIFFQREEELGTVAKGKLADLVLLEQNPLTDIKNIKSVNGVVKNGKFYDRVYLDNVVNELKGKAIEE